MIVPSMTLEEIRKEINKDYNILQRKIYYVTLDYEKKISKDQKKKGFTKTFDYYSKYKNHWIYRIEIINKNPTHSAILVYHNGRGHAGILMTEDDNLIYHTGHFFERYNERRKLELKTLTEIIHTYLDDSGLHHFEKLEEIAPGIFTIFCISRSGVIMGTYNKELKLLKANTYLPNDMLSKNQSEIKTEIINTLKKYGDTSADLF